MGKFFARNIDRRGRIVRAVWGLFATQILDSIEDYELEFLVSSPADRRNIPKWGA